MKKYKGSVVRTYLYILGLFLTLSASAKDYNFYTTIFYQHIDTESCNLCAEVEDHPALLSLGIEWKYAGYEIAFNNHGTNIGLYFQTSTKWNLQSGLFLLNDESRLPINDFPTANGKENVVAPFLGIQYKNLILRYFQYDIGIDYQSHIFRRDEKGNVIEIIPSPKFHDNVRREQIWLGVNFDF